MAIRPWLMCCNKEGTMAQKKVNAVIHSQEKHAEGIYSMWLDASEMAEVVFRDSLSLFTQMIPSKLLPRPISICEADKENGRLRIVYRIAGAGTKEFSECKAGDTLDIMGPLGNGFPLKKKKAFLIGRRDRNPADAGTREEPGLRKDSSHRLQRSGDLPCGRASQIC